MPPQHRFLASRLQSYVCRACLSKSKVTLRQQPQWLSRNATNGRGPLRSTEASQQIDQEPDVRYFEEAPDGTRVEIDMLKDFEKQIQAYEKDAGKSIEDLLGPVDFEGLLNAHGELEPLDRMEHESMAALDKETEELEALVERLENTGLSSLSAEDSVKLREELLKLGTTDESTPSETVPNTNRSFAPRLKHVKVSTKVRSFTPRLKGVKVDLIPLELFDQRHRVHIHQLNQALIRSKISGTRSPVRRPLSTTPKDIWKQYLLARNALRLKPHAIPPQAWKILWDKIAAMQGRGMDKMRRIKILGEDIVSAGVQLDPPRKLLYIESIFISGDRNIAFKEWEGAEQLQNDQSYLQIYCKLGVWMFSQTGDIIRATRAAERYLNGSQDPSRFRILLPIIQASLNSKEKYSIQFAWALYIRMRSNLGSQMTMKDYDAVTLMFLTANQPDLALGAFTDMMLTGRQSAAEQDSTAQYKKVVGLDQFNSIAIQKREFNWENSRTLAKLPYKFNNRFFFGSWIKKLIGEGKLDAAKQVFDLMQSRRIKPDSKHMNGLIGAWFRQGTDNTRVLAEDMAWKMIQARIEFVNSREVSYNLSSPLHVVESRGLRDSKVLTLTPSATPETFAILIEQYRRRQKPELIVDLLNALRSARVCPSTYFMNQLLLCDSRAHHQGWAWDTYFSLSRETGVRPDFDTYGILWKLMKGAYGNTFKQPGSFTTCRRLFADMVERAGKEGFPRDIYDLIISSFSLALDQTGTAVALRAMQRYFGVYPDDGTARIIVLQLARLGLTDDSGDKPKRFNLRLPEAKQRIDNVTRILEGFYDQRKEVLAQQGVVFEELDGDAKAEELLLLLSDLLRYVSQARIAAEQRHSYNATTASQTAAEQMGVPDCVPWVAHNKGEIDLV